jgi:hypothetical protein
LTRISTPQTLKIKGYIKKKKVIVLIDSGSTHNFIHYKLAKDLNCFVYPAPEFQVMIADGGTINCSGKCNKINLTMGEYVMNSPMIAIQKVLLELHNSPIGGHSRFLKTYHRVKKDFFGDGLKANVQRFVAECVVCQQNKVETIKTLGLLQPLSIPSQRWEEVSMDFITGLPKSEGKSVIMVIVDRLINYAHFCALCHPFKASTVATTFMETVQKLHGSPKIIVSDRDLIFTGHFWTKLFSCLGTQLAHSLSYHPQSDGQTEIVKKCLEGNLHCFVSDKQTQWFKWLPLEEW